MASGHEHRAKRPNGKREGSAHARSQGQYPDQPRTQPLVAYLERLSQSNAGCDLGTARHCRHRDCVLVFVVDCDESWRMAKDLRRKRIPNRQLALSMELSSRGTQTSATS
jgi:hypothetical protein